MSVVMTTPMLQARDIILQCLLVRKGALLTEMVCRERANNCAQALMELLGPLTTVTVEVGAIPQGNPGDDEARELAEKYIK